MYSILYIYIYIYIVYFIGCEVPEGDLLAIHVGARLGGAQDDMDSSKQITTTTKIGTTDNNRQGITDKIGITRTTQNR